MKTKHICEVIDQKLALIEAKLNKRQSTLISRERLQKILAGYHITDAGFDKPLTFSVGERTDWLETRWSEILALDVIIGTNVSKKAGKVLFRRWLVIQNDLDKSAKYSRSGDPDLIEKSKHCVPMDEDSRRLPDRL
jgi:hypothetical protein